jgi:anaerobic selenocysteine-containing dehydrogenase
VPIHYRTCNLCEAMCGVALDVDQTRILSVRGDDHDPFSRGHICPKAVGLKDIHEDPDRLRTPLRREGSKFVSIGWEEALDETARGLADVQAKHGRSSVAVYQGNPTVHNYGSMLFGQLFVRALGTKARFSATSADQLPHMLASLEMFGHQLLLPVPDLDRTSHLLMLGANPIASNGSLMTAPDVGKRLAAIRDRGGKVVVVDPRRTETAKIADEHVFIRPGSDAFLLMALVQVLFQEKLARPGRLAEFTDGIEVVEALAAQFAPETVSGVTGIPAERIRRMARELAAADRGVVYGRVGICTQTFGGLAAWLVNVLNVLTGNLDREGGSMFTSPAVDIVELMAKIGQKGHFDRGRSRVRGLPEFGGELPVAVLAEEMETPGPGQIRGFVTSSGNPVLSTPNGVRLERALAGLDFMVSIDIYLNETTRHANIILPPTFALEHDNYDLAFHALAIRNTAKYSPALFPKPKTAKHDWEIFLELERRLSVRGKPMRGPGAFLKAEALGRLGPDGVLDLLLRTGPHGMGRGGLSLARLKKEPHGVDLGPLEPRLPARLYTAKKRIALAPPRLLGDVARLTRALAEHRASPPTLMLIGRRDLRSNNSWMHNSLRLVKGRDRCTLLVHPEDAQKRGIEAGSRVRLSSRAGTIEVVAEISDSVMPGVVSLPHGWGHHREGIALVVARAHAGKSVNDVTDDGAVDELSGNAVLNGVPVDVERVSAFATDVARG